MRRKGMLRIPVQSRKGNLALIILGTIYSLGALTVLVRFLVEVHNAAGRLDRLMQLSLVVAASCGIWFVVNALQNLGIRPTGRGLAHFHRG
jgi:hypothetical protein